MPIKVIRDDITRVKCDAVVNAANKTLLGGGGVDGAIHKAAGKELNMYCLKLGGCETGEAKITPGFKLPCKYIIHTVGPVYIDGKHNEEKLLRSCCINSLSLAEKNNCSSVAFPLISTGAYRYPKKEAFNTAVDAINDFLEDKDMLVYIVLYDSDAFLIGKDLSDDIEEYIDNCYVDDNIGMTSCRMPNVNSAITNDVYFNDYGDADDFFTADEVTEVSDINQSLDEAVKCIDESFSQMLLRKIDEKNMSDAQCYKKANIDRKHFSKIRSNVNYKPSKATAISFAIALELSLEETNELLMKAGYALSHSNKSDIIVEYFIKHKIYNLFEINEALYSFDQPLIGA